ncbi:MAG: 50S ribosomal protein L30 [Chloroflexi bacterium]|nr:50S ribosomal protein L30 [Chloroflexota bacterium]
MARLKITLIKSVIGYAQDQRDTLRALGLRRLGQWVTQPNSPPVLGMVEKVRHLLKVEETG